MDRFSLPVTPTRFESIRKISCEWSRQPIGNLSCEQDDSCHCWGKLKKYARLFKSENLNFGIQKYGSLLE